MSDVHILNQLQFNVFNTAASKPFSNLAGDSGYPLKPYNTDILPDPDPDDHPVFDPNPTGVRQRLDVMRRL